ncbi:arginine--tRNA ligase [Candidatus Uhrbacteria bacterium]|nr:arginine--tRNA ligase [Candidatus Uhrbacteria bacterium]
MPALTDAKQEAVRLLKAALGKQYTPVVDDLETPPDRALGDLAFPCFTLAKGLKRNPAELAVEIAAKVETGGLIRKAEAKGPYVNFSIQTSMFADSVLSEIASRKGEYGTAEAANGKRVLVEYAQPNTHKEIHVGHLRNFFIGHAAVLLLKAAGYEVIPATYINDLGMHVAKCLWDLKKFHTGEPVPAGNAERVVLLGRVYAEATAAAEADPAAKEDISKIFQDLEAGRGPYLVLWKKTRKWSLDEMKGVFKEVGLSFDVWYFESDLIPAAHALVADFKRKGIAVDSQGAVIVDLEAEGLGANLLVRSDGTLLYNAKDLPLALKKEEDFHPDRSVYVVDNRQSLALRQLFATLRRAGFQKDLVHLAYDFVTLKEGAMSSRKGNIIRYQEFRDAILERARTETRARHADWSPKKVERTARAVAFAALRFGMLRQDPAKPILFDMDEALSFDGFTGPYLLYTLARAKSILRKARGRKVAIDGRKLVTPSEHRLVLTLAQYPSVVFETAQDFRFDRIAQCLFDLSKAFSEFYQEVPVLQSGADVATVGARLVLVKAVVQVLENGLTLLGLPTVDEM